MGTAPRKPRPRFPRCSAKLDRSMSELSYDIICLKMAAWRRGRMTTRRLFATGPRGVPAAKERAGTRVSAVSAIVIGLATALVLSGLAIPVLHAAASDDGQAPSEKRVSPAFKADVLPI